MNFIRNLFGNEQSEESKNKDSGTKNVQTSTPKQNKAIAPLVAELRRRESTYSFAWVERWRAAAEKLGEIGDNQAVEPLVEAALENFNVSDWTQRNRKTMVEALQKIGDPRAVELLISKIRSEKDYKRSQAAETLGEMRDPHAVEALVMALDDESEGVRIDAALALGKIGDKRAVEPLREHLYGRMGAAVSIALEQIGVAPEKEGEILKLAVIAHQEPSGSLRLIGDDAFGRSFYLGEVEQPALLFIPKDTLPYLKRDRGLWRRVKNPEASLVEKPKPVSESADNLLSSLLADPLTQSIEAPGLSAGEFRIIVVDTYYIAKTTVEGIGLFGRKNK